MKISSAMNIRRLVLCGASLSALLPALAHAQATGAQSPQSTEAPAAQTTVPAAPVDAQPGGAVDEVVVTAQRREERLKDVPVSVAVTTATDLQRQGITSTRELTTTTPGLVMGMKAGAAIQPAIRGIS